MANNICTRRPDDTLVVECEIFDCDELASYDCYPALAPGITSLQTKIALCEQHAREADPGLQHEVQS